MILVGWVGCWFDWLFLLCINSVVFLCVLGVVLNFVWFIGALRLLSVVLCLLVAVVSFVFVLLVFRCLLALLLV